MFYSHDVKLFCFGCVMQYLRKKHLLIKCFNQNQNITRNIHVKNWANWYKKKIIYRVLFFFKNGKSFKKFKGKQEGSQTWERKNLWLQQQQQQQKIGSTNSTEIKLSSDWKRRSEYKRNWRRLSIDRIDFNTRTYSNF